MRHELERDLLLTDQVSAIDEAAAGDLYTIVDRLLEPHLDRLTDGLANTGLTGAEQRVVHAAAVAGLREAVRLRTMRLLVVELNAARVTGKLTAADSRARWNEWVAMAARQEFWDSLSDHYPTLSGRLRTMIGNRCAAALSLAGRFAADRSAMGALLGGEPGELLEIKLNAGDSHRGGQTVAILRCAAGRVVYKPRSVAVDFALGRFLGRLLADELDPTRIRVPEVVRGDGYGWVEHVAHRYCADDVELRRYYYNLGLWVAVMRLLGGSDLHAENLIAVGPVPVVVDCETLFTPRPQARESGYGLAVDRAGSLVDESALGTGLLPSRGLALGWRGVDMSGIGSLPGQQPSAEIPLIVDAGTDRARVGYARAPIPETANQPTASPVLGKYWDHVVDGFTLLTRRLRRLDDTGELEPMLAEFADLPIRVVPRSTESYAELQRMLWHPESLHDEPAARRRVADLLVKQADRLPGVPGDPEVVDAEIDELLDGDVPFFATTPRRGWLSGPGGTRWGPAQDLVAGALGRWRAADLALERRVIQSALVGAYLNEGWLPEVRRLFPSDVATDDLDRRRRTVAADIVRALADAAVWGDDGTVTWIAPVLHQTGWAVRPLGIDMYGGASGVAVLLGAYLCEMRQDRADPVAGVRPLLAAVLQTMRKADEQWARDRAEAGKTRPAPVGGYIGLGSWLWGWLLLRRLGVVDSAEVLSRMEPIVREIADAVDADSSYDLMAGMSGAVVPLLWLGEHSGNTDALNTASDIGRRLKGAAKLRDDAACWPNPEFPEGLGGLSHGVTGIGWALSRLAAATGDPEVGGLADAAFTYEEALYNPESGGWRDMRAPELTPAVWCHGAGGIGVVAADQLRHGAGEYWHDVLRRAAAACWSTGMGWTHTLCHGDLGAWEVLDAAIAAGAGPPGMDRPTLDARILSSLDEHGPVSGLAREDFAPALLPGLGGVAYQLLRMHPDCTLPSVLLPDPAL